MRKPLVFNQFLPIEVCNALMSGFSAHAETTVFDKKQLSKKDETIRKGQVQFLQLQEQSFMSKFTKILPKLEILYDAKELDFEERLQLLKYEAGDHFESWHSDVGNYGYSSERFLTFILLLSDNNSFTGGELEFQDFSGVNPPQQGGLIVFPSNLVHRLKKVIMGSRFSMVTWASVSS